MNGSVCLITSRSFICFLFFGGYNGNRICDDEVPIDGKTWRFFLRHTTTTSFWACLLDLLADNIGG